MGNEKSGDDTEKHPDEKIFWFVAIGFIAMIVAPGIYAYAFQNYNLGGPDDWGSFATYFSGIVTPIVALCSAVLFFRSILAQRDEFEKTRQEMQQATKHQVDAEEHRFNLETQKQLERAISVAKDLEEKTFKVVNDLAVGLAPEIHEDTNQKFRERQLYQYCERGLNLITMIDKYLDANGDVHLILGWLEDLEVQYFRVIELATNYELEEVSNYRIYLERLDLIKNRRDRELRAYSQ